MKRNILLFLAAFCCVAGCKDDSVGSTVNSSCTCPEGQVCSAGGDCYANAACAACTADENCVGGVCYAKDTACGACRPEQVCTNDTCYAANDPCAQCEGKVCVSGVCYEKSSPCAQCKPDEKCVGETCYAKATDEALKGAAADFLKRVYFALRNSGPEYQAGYEKYNAIAGGE